MAKQQVIWTSKLNGCDWCCSPFAGGVMYDASLKARHEPRAMWGNACHKCFTARDGQLGIGRGQRYDLNKEGRYECTAGNEE